MSIQIVDNFQVNNAKAIDNRFVVGPSEFYTDKDNIPYKYAGMRVWDLNVGIPFVWTGTTFSTESASSISGSGTPNYIPKFVSPGNVIQNSIIYDNATNVGIGTIVPDKKLTVAGDIKSTGAGGFYGIGTNITNINASNITTGTLNLARLQNGTLPGSILIAATSQVVYSFNVTLNTPPGNSGGSTTAINSPSGIAGEVGIIYLKNSFGPSKIYSDDSSDGHKLKFQSNPGGTLMTLDETYFTSNNPFRSPNGSSTSPSISFINNSNMGFYRAGSNIIGLSIAGSVKTLLTTTSMVLQSGYDITVSSTGNIYIQNNGSVSDPSLKIGASNTGIYRDISLANSLALVTGGRKRFQVRTGGAADYEFHSLLGDTAGSSKVGMSVYDSGFTVINLTKSPTSTSNRLAFSGFNANTIDGIGGVEFQNGIAYRYTSSFSIPNASGTTFNHNLGYIPIAVVQCQDGNLNLNITLLTATQIRVYNFNSGGNTANGNIYLW